jgi:hypothetical protein
LAFEAGECATVILEPEAPASASHPSCADLPIDDIRQILDDIGAGAGAAATLPTVPRSWTGDMPVTRSACGPVQVKSASSGLLDDRDCASRR